MREVRAFAEGVELVSFFELSVQGEEDEGAIADDRAVSKEINSAILSKR